MRTSITLSIALLCTSMTQCSQIEEGSIVSQILQRHTCAAATGRTLAERHAWWQFKHNRGPIPEFSPNQLGQDDIRHPNTPIPDSYYDTLFVPATLVAHLLPFSLVITIHGPEKEDRTSWINGNDFPATWRYALGSKQNPITL